MVAFVGQCFPSSHPIPQQPCEQVDVSWTGVSLRHEGTVMTNLDFEDSSRLWGFCSYLVYHFIRVSLVMTLSKQSDSLGNYKGQFVESLNEIVKD